MSEFEKGNGKYNVVVIGGGSAGLITAAATSGLGGRVALIERHKMGGDCLNYGCVPSKALISSARAVDAMRKGEKWGLPRTEPEFDFLEVFNSMRKRRARIEPNDSKERFESLGVDVFLGDAAFLSPQEVQVGGMVLKARNFVIAAGCSAALPPIPGLTDVKHFTNETIFDELHEKPGNLAVIGGGPIGVELSQTFHRLGVDVTIVEFAPQILLREDPDVVQFIKKQFEDEGIRILDGAETKRIAAQNGRIRFDISRKTANNGDGENVQLDVDAVLVAAGRRPNINGLNLEAAGVAYTNNGITVNDYLQTSQPHIYAAGDIVGPYQFTHMADYHARIVVRNILIPLVKSKVDYSAVPWCTYTDPEIARVGLNEADAKARNIEYDLFDELLANVDRAIVEGDDSGFVKVLTDKGSDRILGVTLVAPHAGDLLHEFVLAMQYRIGLGKIAATIHAYPTFAEIARKAGDKYNRSRLTPFTQKLFKWLYRRAII